MAAVAVYYRLGNIVVIPQGGGGGHFIDIDPVVVVAPVVDVVQGAVIEALKVSSISQSTDVPPKGWKSPVLKYFGLRSYKAFTANASLCYVFEDAGILEVERWIRARDGRGYEQAPEGSRILNSPQDVGSTVIETFEIH